MNSSSITTNNKSKKFTHSSAKIIHFSTFFLNTKLCYFIQNDKYEVYIGYLAENFQLLWKGCIRQKILCQAYSSQYNILYAGTNKGTIAIINLSQKYEQISNNIQKQGQVQKWKHIGAVSGQAILGMITYINKEQKIGEIIAVNSEGIIHKYANNKYSKSIKLPFKITKIQINKNIKEMNDISVVLFKQKGTFPYIFSPFHLISMFSPEANQQYVNKLIGQYEGQQNLYPDQEILSQNVTSIAISTTRPNFAIIQKKQHLTLYHLHRSKISNHFIIEPTFRITQKQQISDIDIIDQFLLYICPKKGLSTFNIDKRNKVGRGLSFKGSTQYQIGCWVDVSNRMVLIGSNQSSNNTSSSKSRLTIHQLNTK